LAALISQELNIDCDVLVVKKISSPFSKEVAIGATSEEGETVLSREYAEHSRNEMRRSFLDRAASEAKQECISRSHLYRAHHPAKQLEGRDVILVDDGIATGSTMEVAIKVARSKHARRVIVAVPVMPSDRVYHFRDLADELVYLMAPSEFLCVSQFYAHFPQLNHGDVIDLLEIERLRAQERAT